MFFLFIIDLSEYAHNSNIRLFVDDGLLNRNICANADTVTIQEISIVYRSGYPICKCQLLRVTNKRKLWLTLTTSMDSS